MRISDLMEKEAVNPSFFILHRSPLSFWPLLLSWPLSGFRIRSVLLFYPALLRPPIPRDFRLPFGFPKLRRMCIRFRAAIPSLSTSPRTNRACLTRSSIVPQVFSLFSQFQIFKSWKSRFYQLCTEQDFRSSNFDAHIVDIYRGISGELKEYRH